MKMKENIKEMINEIIDLAITALSKIIRIDFMDEKGDYLCNISFFGGKQKEATKIILHLTKDINSLERIFQINSIKYDYNNLYECFKFYKIEQKDCIKDLIFNYLVEAYIEQKFTISTKSYLKYLMKRELTYDECLRIIETTCRFQKGNEYPTGYDLRRQFVRDNEFLNIPELMHQNLINLFKINNINFLEKSCTFKTEDDINKAIPIINKYIAEQFLNNKSYIDYYLYFYMKEKYQNNNIIECIQFWKTNLSLAVSSIKSMANKNECFPILNHQQNVWYTA